MHEYWIIEIGAGFLAILILQWGLKKAFTVYRQTADQKHWDVKLDAIILPPLRLLVWIFGISYVFFVVSNRFGPFFGAEYFGRIRDAVITTALAWVAFRWKRRLEERWLAKSSDRLNNTSAIHAIGKLLTFLIVITTALVILYILGVNVLPLLAFGGIGAAAVGFAAKDMIANFFGGLMLYLTRPFVEGEEIYIQKDNIQGVVEEIGWYLTSLRDLEKRPIYIPNAQFSSAYVVNASRRSHRKIIAVFSVDGSQASKIEILVEEVTRRLCELHFVDQTMPKYVSLEQVVGDGLELLMEVYTKDAGLEKFRKVKQDVLLAVLEIFKIQGITSSLPKTIVKIDRSAEEDL